MLCYIDSWFFGKNIVIFYCVHLRVVPVTLHCLLYFSAPLNSEMHSWRRFDKLYVIRCVEWAFHLLWLLIQLKLSLAVELVVTTTEGMFPTIKEVRWIINPVVTWCIVTWCIAMWCIVTIVTKEKANSTILRSNFIIEFGKIS